MIDIQPFIHKLDLLGEYINLFIDGLEGKSFMDDCGKINVGYSGSRYISHTCVLRVNSYETPSMWIMPFEDWIQLKSNNHDNTK